MQSCRHESLQCCGKVDAACIRMAHKGGSRRRAAGAAVQAAAKPGSATEGMRPVPLSPARARALRLGGGHGSTCLVPGARRFVLSLILRVRAGGATLAAAFFPALAACPTFLVPTCNTRFSSPSDSTSRCRRVRRAQWASHRVYAGD